MSGGAASRRALVFGDVIDDIVVRPDAPPRADTDTTARIERRPGGSAANVAAWLGWLGTPVDFIGRVGADDLERHRAALAALGVTPLLIADAELPTGTIVVIVVGEQRTMLTSRGANLALDPAVVDEAALAGHGVLHVTGYSVFSSPGAIPALIARAHAAGAAVSVDASSAGYLADFGAERFLAAIAGADILLPNSAEATALTGRTDPRDAAARLSERFPVVAVTAGAAGTIVVADRALSEVPAGAAAPVEPTGAGDAFSAGFLAAWLDHGDAARAARAGSEVAVRALGVIGGRPPAADMVAP